MSGLLGIVSGLAQIERLLDGEQTIVAMMGELRKKNAMPKILSISTTREYVLVAATDLTRLLSPG